MELKDNFENNINKALMNELSAQLQMIKNREKSDEPLKSTEMLVTLSRDKFKLLAEAALKYLIRTVIY